MQAKDNYEKKKENLLADLQKNPTHRKISLRKSTSNLFRPQTGSNKDKKIDVRNFNQVVQIDPQNRRAEIEGMATYFDIVNETLAYGFLPPVVPELKSITVGGA